MKAIYNIAREKRIQQENLSLKSRIKKLETALQSFVGYLDSNLTLGEEYLKDKAQKVLN